MIITSKESTLSPLEDAEYEIYIKLSVSSVQVAIGRYKEENVDQHAHIIN